MRLDPLDERIVALLLEDGRASFADIGAKIGLSAPAVKRRVDRLRQVGAITGFTAKVDPRALGWTTEAYVELYCQGKTSPATIRDGVARFPEVVSACTLTGEADALVHVLAADIHHFEEVLERMNAEPYVARTKSVLVLSRLLERPGLTATT
ncbi:Lrp/AsnC family transcriptional regulator [Actinopolymorpha alba]|uniref:Lrp/AsnC family transcriptional regulator n=1 Tax=Actinopolymorpha alba TaxID=533267 RepID=UPI0003624F11|nr:Lrp/AsnC family transcriptional regulator [Actinopolymorpha alba]